ncbi:biotin/lipoyl-containing protein, partial [Streptosporangium sp. KLBMP 9127]|nr:biotin/lipoyl-binding protein [Streptosporangium sp. KLBMP 9127]
FAGVIEPYAGAAAAVAEGEPAGREHITVEVGGKRLEVVLPAGFGAAVPAGAAKPARRVGGRRAAAAASGNALTSPMQGTIVKVAVEDGAAVAEGDVIVVLEAMKMEQPLTAHKAGTVTGLSARVGEGVTAGVTICEISG